MPHSRPQSFATRQSPLAFSRAFSSVIHAIHASFVFILLRTLLHCAKRYPQSFQRLPHSFRKTPGVGEYVPRPARDRIWVAILTSAWPVSSRKSHVSKYFECRVCWSVQKVGGSSALLATHYSLRVTHCSIQTNLAARARCGPTAAGIGTIPPSAVPPANASA